MTRRARRWWWLLLSVTAASGLVVALLVRWDISTSRVRPEAQIDDRTDESTSVETEPSIAEVGVQQDPPRPPPGPPAATLGDTARATGSCRAAIHSSDRMQLPVSKPKQTTEQNGPSPARTLTLGDLPRVRELAVMVRRLREESTADSGR